MTVSVLYVGGCYFFIAKIASKKSGASIRSINFLFPEVALYFYKSTIQPCIEYCCYVLDGAPSLLLGYVRYVTEISMQDSWLFICCFS